jgi:protein ImuB
MVCVFFPALTMERWRRVISTYRTAPDEALPVVLSQSGTHGPVISALNQTARDRGISAGDRVVDAQAIHPDLHVEPADLRGDELLMERLVHWSRRWCPWTAQDGAAGLVLDVTGSVHLFGGEAALLRDICQRFAMQGLSARVAMTPTRGAGRALSRFGPAVSQCGPEDVSAALAPLPVAALGLSPDTARLLHRLGLKTIGDLAQVPRVSMMRRFANLAAADNPLILLDQALGHAAEPLNAPPDPQHFMARARLAEPVMDPTPYMAALSEDLCRALAQAEQGARQLRLTIYRIDGESLSVSRATARASRDPAHLIRLFDDQLSGMDPGFGFDLITLEALRAEPLARVQSELDGKRNADADLAGLLDRLTARLGKERVSWPVSEQTHKPERVAGRVAALEHPPGEVLSLPRERPVRLLHPPEEVQVIYAVPEGPPSQFRWRRVLYKTARFAGPERIAPEWWRDRPGTRLRDYYKVEVAHGGRFWLYREGLPDDQRGGTPRWFLHGLFA